MSERIEDEDAGWTVDIIPRDGQLRLLVEAGPAEHYLLVASPDKAREVAAALLSQADEAESKARGAATGYQSMQLGQQCAHPGCGEELLHGAERCPSHQQRLDAAGGVDLRDNLRMVPLGGGYARAEPVDPARRHGRGVESELGPLVVRAPQRVEACTCGHPLRDHETEGTGQCWFDTGPATGYCTCLTFSERTDDTPDSDKP